MRKFKSITTHTHTHKAVCYKLFFIILILFFTNKNTFSQAPFENSSSGDPSGYLYHIGGVSLGMTDQPQSILHLHKHDDLSNVIAPAFIQFTNVNTGKNAKNGLKVGIGSETFKGAYINQQEDDDLYFQTNDKTRLTIKNTGKVGIGTTNPNVSLQVNTITIPHVNPIGTGTGNTISGKVGLDNYSIIQITNNNTGQNYYDGLQLGVVNKIAFIKQQEDAPLYFYTNNHNRLTITKDGKVGLGTNSPQLDLDVRGKATVKDFVGINTVDVSDPNIRLNIGGNYSKLKIGTTSEYIKIGRDGANNYIESFDADSFLFVNHYSKSATIFGGNVGIGTGNTHGYKLAVKGYAIAEDFTVAEYQDWPDYVFNKNYKIKDLNDLEKYIKQNNHLPNIPTAEEVEKDGVKLGEMNTKLLQKVEELTLYIIEQDKRIKKLEEVINK